MLRLLTAAAALALVATPAAAAPCKDPKTGKFVKCPPAKATRCKGADGKFANCGTRRARPVG